MSLPTVLLVDDSESIVAFERAALTGRYSCVSASNGKEALEKAVRIKPRAILLDLSMPVMDGYEALQHLKADPELSKIPVVVISSEADRANECEKAGASAFIPKPIQAAQLISTLEKVLEKSRQEDEAQSLTIMVLKAAGVSFGIRLNSVEQVIPQLVPYAIPTGPPYLDEAVVLDDQVIPVLNLAQRLGREAQVPYLERRIVILNIDGLRLGIAVDEIFDPERIDPGNFTPASEMAVGDHGRLAQTLVAFANSSAGHLAVIQPKSFLSQRHMRRLKLLADSATKSLSSPESTAHSPSAADLAAFSDGELEFGERVDSKSEPVASSEVQDSEALGLGVQETEIQGSGPEIQDSEVQNSEIQDSEVQDSEVQDSEIQDSEIQDSEIQDSEIQDSEIQNSEVQDSEVQDSEVQDSEVQNTEVQVSENQDSETLDSAAQAAGTDMKKGKP